MNNINTKNLLKLIRETNINDVFPDKNVLGLGWGPKIKDGKETGEYSLIFTVDSKKPLSAIPPNQLLPNTYQFQNVFYKTDVQEKKICQKLNENSISTFSKISVSVESQNIKSFDDIQPLNATQSYTDCNIISNTTEPVKSNRIRRRELKSGCETIGGDWGAVVGTLGTFAIDKSDGQIVALSNNHVFAKSQILSRIQSKIVTNISTISAYQPSGYWKTTIEDDYIGTAKRVVPIGNIDSTQVEFGRISETSCDAAIVKLKSYDGLINSNSLKPIGFEFAPPYPFATDEEIDSLLDSNSVNFGAPLFRSGRTCGAIGYPGNSQSCSLSAYEFNTVEVGLYSGYNSFFSNCFLFRGDVVPGRGGDSGSMVLGLFDRGTPDEKWKIIGLLFAGPYGDFPAYSIGCRITNIARDLNLIPWDGTYIPTLSSNSTHVILDETTSDNHSATVNLSGRVFYQLGRSTLPSIPKYNLYFSNGVEDTTDAYQFCQYTPILKLNEGISGFIELETNNVSEDISYTITGISQEYINIPLNGNFSNGYGRTQFTVSEDFLTEGTETIIVELDGITPTVSAALIINATNTLALPTPTPIPPTPTPTPIPTFRNWTSITSSAYGNKLAAVAAGDQIYTSTDSGVTWTARESNRGWRGITSSADGTKLAAVVSGGQIYTSTDSGVTWTPRESNRIWYSITSSAEGNKLAAVAAGAAGQIYTSDDYGVTWTPRGDINRNWYSITSSSDGTKLAAVVYNGQIYTSDDSGVTWTARESNRGWWSITSSADGTKLAAVAQYGRIYISDDSGVTWTARGTIQGWRGITSSADGTKLAAVVGGGQIYTSTDSVVTWTARESVRDWTSITSSSDGTKLAAVNTGNYIYTSDDYGVTWIPRF